MNSDLACPGNHPVGIGEASHTHPRISLMASQLSHRRHSDSENGALLRPVKPHLTAMTGKNLI